VAEVLGLVGIAERGDLDRVRAGGDVAGRPRVVGPSTSMRTRTVPGPTMPIVRAAAYERSMARPSTNGPRSLTRTCTARPFSRLVTMTRVPSGSEGCAAVSSYWS